MTKASPFYDYDELVHLTGKKRKSAQHAELNRLGIIHKIRSDGSMLVLRAHVEEMLGGRNRERKQKEVEPNWDAMHSK